MHTHPTPVQIKNEIIKAMIERFDNMPSNYVSAMFDAVDAGIKKANENHDDLLKAMNNV